MIKRTGQHKEHQYADDVPHSITATQQIGKAIMTVGSASPTQSVPQCVSVFGRDCSARISHGCFQVSEGDADQADDSSRSDQTAGEQRTGADVAFYRRVVELLRSMI